MCFTIILGTANTEEETGRTEESLANAESIGNDIIGILDKGIILLYIHILLLFSYSDIRTLM